MKRMRKTLTVLCGLWGSDFVVQIGHIVVPNNITVSGLCCFYVSLGLLVRAVHGGESRTELLQDIINNAVEHSGK